MQTLYLCNIYLIVTSGPPARDHQGCLADIDILFFSRSCTEEAARGGGWVGGCGSDIVSGDHVWSAGAAA